MSTVLAVDPGKSSGWALFSDQGTLLEHGILPFDDMLALLAAWPWGDPPQVVVYESFTLDYRAAKQKGSTLEASQVIGALRLSGRLWPAIVVPQRTEARDMGYVHAGLARAGRHADSHDRDAVAHGYYWFEAQGQHPTLGEHGHLRTTRVDTGVLDRVD